MANFQLSLWQKIKKEWKREHRISKGGMYYLCPMVWFPFAFFGFSTEPLPHSRGSMATATFSFGPLPWPCFVRPTNILERRGWVAVADCKREWGRKGPTAIAHGSKNGKKTEISMASFPSSFSRLNSTFYSFLPPASIEAAGSWSGWQ
jgi:hypothetical protein